ncbi:MAG: hypothetical protein KVP17_004414 [Porospora cf. gigantea B]|uniref:uncharacterized protein n=2 Tax=Porospora cf. gigantea B TaxID=2853592 RepID=UPI003571E9AA|nr:MAG: hypothetical protein KVP17_004414 [Porospora cf. gigantea B]
MWLWSKPAPVLDHEEVSLDRLKQVLERFGLQLSSLEEGCRPPGKPIDVSSISETLRAASELVVIGEQRGDETYFTLFCESRMLDRIVAFFDTFSGVHNVAPLQIQLFQSLNVLLQNLKQEGSLYCLMSRNLLNKVVATPLCLSDSYLDDELISWYVNFLKSVSRMLSPKTVRFMHNDACSSFPLLLHGLKFLFSKDALVKTTVRNMTLALLGFDDAGVQQSITSRYSVFECIALSLRDVVTAWQQKLQLVAFDKTAVALLKMKSLRDDLVDVCLFLEDVLCLNKQEVSQLLFHAITHTVVLPYLFPAFLGHIDQKKEAAVLWDDRHLGDARMEADYLGVVGADSRHEEPPLHPLIAMGVLHAMMTSMPSYRPFLSALLLSSEVPAEFRFVAEPPAAWLSMLFSATSLATTPVGEVFVGSRSPLLPACSCRSWAGLFKVPPPAILSAIGRLGSSVCCRRKLRPNPLKVKLLEWLSSPCDGVHTDSLVLFAAALVQLAAKDFRLTRASSDMIPEEIALVRTLHNAHVFRKKMRHIVARALLRTVVVVLEEVPFNHEVLRRMSDECSGFLESIHRDIRVSVNLAEGTELNMASEHRGKWQLLIDLACAEFTGAQPMSVSAADVGALPPALLARTSFFNDLRSRSLWCWVPSKKIELDLGNQLQLFSAVMALRSFLLQESPRARPSLGISQPPALDDCLGIPSSQMIADENVWLMKSWICTSARKPSPRYLIIHSDNLLLTVPSSMGFPEAKITCVCPLRRIRSVDRCDLRDSDFADYHRKGYRGLIIAFRGNANDSDLLETKIAPAKEELPFNQVLQPPRQVSKKKVLLLLSSQDRADILESQLGDFVAIAVKRAFSAVDSWMISAQNCVSQI